MALVVRFAQSTSTNPEHSINFNTPRTYAIGAFFSGFAVRSRSVYEYIWSRFLTGTVHLLDNSEIISKGLAVLQVFAPHPFSCDKNRAKIWENLFNSQTQA